MEKLVDNVTFYLSRYLYEELTAIICSYLIGFNTMPLILEKSFSVFIFNYYKINIHNNKIYILICENESIIIYDIKRDETIYFDTKLNNINSLCSIDDNNIILATNKGLYIYNYNIVNKKISILDVKQKFDSYYITEVYYSKNKIIFQTNEKVHIYNSETDFLYCCYYNALLYYNDYICLYDECLYILDSESYAIDIYNINERKYIGKVSLLFDLSKKGDNVEISKIFVCEAYIYIVFFKYMNVFTHDGEFIRRIEIPNSNYSFHVDSDRIYQTKKFINSINLSIFQQKFKLGTKKYYINSD